MKWAFRKVSDPNLWPQSSLSVKILTKEWQKPRSVWIWGIHISLEANINLATLLLKFSGGCGSALFSTRQTTSNGVSRRYMLETKNKGYTEHGALSLPTSPQHSVLSLLFTCSPLHTIATIAFPAYTFKRLLFTNIPHTGAQKTSNNFYPCNQTTSWSFNKEFHYML